MSGGIIYSPLKRLKIRLDEFTYHFKGYLYLNYLLELESVQALA